jgi:hypothetical protein
VADKAPKWANAPEAPAEEAKATQLQDSVTVTKAPEDSAGVTTIAGASFIDSPINKIAYFAKQRFPNLSPDEAFNRYAMMPNGDIVYQKDDGTYAAEVPAGWSPGAIVKRMATGTGSAVSAAPAMATGIATAPMMVTGPQGLATSLAATGAAGAGGEGIRQAIGNYIADDPVSGKDIAKEAAWSAAGQGVGEGIAYAINRRLASDFAQYSPAGTAQLLQKGARAGVDLTLPEAANLPSLKFRQQVVSEMPGSSDRMGEFYARRAGQTDTAMDNFLKSLSANDSVDVAGRRAKEAAFESIDSAVRQQRDSSGPIYEEAFRRFQGLPQSVAQRAQTLMERPSMQDAARAAVRTASDIGIDLGDPRQSLRGMHYMRQELDAMYKQAIAKERGPQANAILRLRQELDGIMREVSPKDDQGRSMVKLADDIFAAHQANVSSLKSSKDSLVGLVAGLGDRKVKDAAAMVLDADRSGPLAMSQFKRAVQAVDPEAWQQIKRAYLQDVWAKAGKRFATGQPFLQPSKFAAAMIHPKQREMLQEAFSPQEMAAFNDLMEVFEATGRGLPRNSTTAIKGQEMRRMEREAGGVPAMALRAGRLASPGQWADWIEEARLGSHADKIAQIITDPNAQTMLKQLKKLSPNEAKFSSLLGQVLTRGTRNAGDAMLQSGQQ